jgi:hypothetical protein
MRALVGQNDPGEGWSGSFQGVLLVRASWTGLTTTIGRSHSRNVVPAHSIGR